MALWFDDKARRLSSGSHKYPKRGKRNEGEQNIDIATLTLSDLEEEDDDEVEVDDDEVEVDDDEVEVEPLLS